MTYDSFVDRRCFLHPAELDALGLEEEEEGPSYLADLNKVPDFIDEAPQELGEVCCLSMYYPCAPVNFRTYTDTSEARSYETNELRKDCIEIYVYVPIDRIILGTLGSNGISS